MTVAALILAGGRGSRLGAEVPKPLVRLSGRPILEFVLNAVPTVARPILLNANEGTAFSAYGLPLVGDLRPDFQGPLAGIEATARSGLLEAAGATHLLVLPGDTPFLTKEALGHLIDAPAAIPRVARCGNQLQPTVALWPILALQAVSAFLDAPGQHSIRAYLDRTGFETVDFENEDLFFNINTPADREAAERRLASS